MIATRFTELVGCTIPIQQAGMGAVAPPELAAAVSEAGGLGMLGTAAGQIAIWDMDGTHITAAAYTRSGATITGAPGADWHLFEHHYDLV